MEKIKILWIITTGLRKNGICVSQLDYFKCIDKNKFQIDTISIDGDNQEMVDEYLKAGCRVFKCPSRYKKIISYLRNLRKILKEENYDIVHVHGSSTLMIFELLTAKICGVKVRIAHSRNTTCDRPWLEKYLRPFFRRSYNVRFACGELAGKWLFPNEKFIVFHNGKDVDKYKFDPNKRKDMRQRLNLNHKIAIGHVGLFNKQKNHDFLIEVFQKIHHENKNTRLYLMGIGPKMAEIKQKVIDYNLTDSVIFLGNINNVSDYLQAMDIMLFPSLFEGLPNVVVEWQFSGLPAIISDKITTECIVSNFVNILPIDNGPELWSEEFKKITINSVDKRNKLAEDACKLLKNNGFELHANTKILENIYIKKVKEYNEKNT